MEEMQKIGDFTGKNGKINSFMKLMYITNDPEIAIFAEQCGVQRIFVDMEYLGKNERQGHLDTHKAKHTSNDVKRIKDAVTEAEVMVRINPLYHGSKKEIDEVLAAGANIIMLPMFTTALEVETFISLVSRRAKVCLLLETPQSLTRLDSILSMSDDIDEIHVGLNDLHLGMGLDFMFELLSSGLVEFAIEKIRSSGIKYGFGGIACLGQGAIPAEWILSEHARLGSEMVILSRTFHQNAKSLSDLMSKIDLKHEIDILQDAFLKYKKMDKGLLLKNREKFVATVNQMIHSKHSGDSNVKYKINDKL